MDSSLVMMMRWNVMKMAAVGEGVASFSSSYAAASLFAAALSSSLLPSWHLTMRSWKSLNWNWLMRSSVTLSLASCLSGQFVSR